MAYQQLGAVAAEGGARIAFETHNVYIHDLAKPTKKLLDMIDCERGWRQSGHGQHRAPCDGESLECTRLEILKGQALLCPPENMLRLRPGGFAAVGLAEGCIDNRQFPAHPERAGLQLPHRRRST